MMKWINLQGSPESKFRRITGVKRSTFEKMIEIITAAEKIKKKRGGRPTTLAVEDRLLMALEYLREYRTYAHIGASYGLSESNAFKNIRWIEDVLVKSKEFRLPGRKALLKSDYEFEVVLIDTTESPIERPKKNNVRSIQGKKSDTP
jgi:hypothetical protein